ncbi:SprT-like domain-containing protein [Nanoarchaeota archaeon]
MEEIVDYAMQSKKKKYEGLFSESELPKKKKVVEKPDDHEKEHSQKQADNSHLGYGMKRLNAEMKKAEEKIESAEDLLDFTHNPKELIIHAFTKLYPHVKFNYIPKIVYSGRFSDYNANVKLENDILEFSLCRKWRDVAPEIQIGLIQELLVKLFKKQYKTPRTTMYIDLYNGFVKRLHYAIPKRKSHPVLEESFNRINAKYFDDRVDIPNLVWGQWSKTKLGSYDYKKDELSISKVFTKLDPILLDMVMYHEMLHKKFSFKSSGTKNYYHTAEFKRAEKQFENCDELEEQLKKKLRYLKIKSLFGFGK